MGGVARISPPIGTQIGLVIVAMKMSTGLKNMSRPPPMKITGRPITTAARRTGNHDYFRVGVIVRREVTGQGLVRQGIWKSENVEVPL